MMTVREIKDAVASGKMIIGSKSVLKDLKRRKINIVIHSSNCPTGIQEALSHYSNISKIKIEKFSGDSVKLGEVCGKPFGINLIAMKTQTR